MNWFHHREKPQLVVANERIASISELYAVFHDVTDQLHWIALVITGDDSLAQQCLASANALATEKRGAARDWLVRWMKSATARIAVRLIRDAVSISAIHYDAWSCTHTDHRTLAERQIRLLPELEPSEIIAALDPLARSVLVLRGMQGATISECALFLEVPRRCVIASYCRALQWLSKRKQQHRAIIPMLKKLA